MEEFIGYMKEISDAGWVHEVISERFDNALALMRPDSVVYGGAVRDALAKKELKGDLDIAVTPDAFMRMSEDFLENPRWIAHNSSGNLFEPEDMGSGKIARKMAPMSGVYQFINMDGMVVQLVTSNKNLKDRFQVAVYPARQVDIVCCGVIMTYDGRVFEVLPGAHQDCIDGVLRINDDSETILLDTLEARVKKLEERGWRNEIDVNQVIREIKAKRSKLKRVKKKRLATSKLNDKEILGVRYFSPPGTDQEIVESGGYTDEVPVDWFPNEAAAVSALEKTAYELRVPCRVAVSCLHRIYVTAKDAETFGQILRYIRGIVSSKPEKRPERAMPIEELPGGPPKRVKATGGYTGRIKAATAKRVRPASEEFVGYEGYGKLEAKYSAPKKSVSYAEWKIGQIEAKRKLTESNSQEATTINRILRDASPEEQEVMIAATDLSAGIDIRATIPVSAAQAINDIWRTSEPAARKEIIQVLRERGHIRDER